MKVVFYTAMLPPMAEGWGTRQPLGFGYLAAYARRTGVNADFRLALTEEEALAEPMDILAISSVTYNWRFARSVAQKARQRHGATIVVGGPHVTALPDRMEREFDIGVLGEGEQTFLDILRWKLAGEPAEALREIDGLVFWLNGERETTLRRALIEPIDSIPFPYRDLFGGADGLRGQTVSLISSRGCPYECLFCSTTLHWESLRVHSAEYIASEIADVVERFEPPLIHFEDDLFVAVRRRLEETAEAILKAGLHQRVSFHVSARANTLNDETCALLKQINARTVFVGFESNSAHVLKALGKRGATPEINQRAIDSMRRHGLKCVGSFILGAPGETRDDAYETYTFVRRNFDVFSHVAAGALRLLPGTEFWRRGVEKGLIDEEMTGVVFDERDADGWDSLNSRYPMLCETMSRGELMGLLLAFTELGCCVSERQKRLEAEARCRRASEMGIRELGAALAARLRRKLGGSK